MRILLILTSSLLQPSPACDDVQVSSWRAVEQLSWKGQ
jgi:hypothetical protein